MKVNKSFYKVLTKVSIVLVIIASLFLGRMVFTMGLSSYVNAEAKSGNSAPAKLYYVLHAFTGDFMQPYLAFYNLGTAYAESEEYLEASVFLSTALAKVDYVYHECYIRNNLSLVYEKMGDEYMADAQPSSAEDAYRKAVETVADSPLECFPPTGGGSGDGEGQPESGEGAPDVSENGKQMKETEKRSEGKEGKAKEAQGKTESGKDKIQQEKDQSTGEMNNSNDQKEQQENNKPDQPPVEKPW